MTNHVPIYRRQAESGTINRSVAKSATIRDEDAIKIDQDYHKDTKTGYIPEHDLTRRQWTGGRNK